MCVLLFVLLFVLYKRVCGCVCVSFSLFLLLLNFYFVCKRKKCVNKKNKNKKTKKQKKKTKKTPNSLDRSAKADL